MQHQTLDLQTLDLQALDLQALDSPRGISRISAYVHPQGIGITFSGDASTIAPRIDGDSKRYHWQRVPEDPAKVYRATGQ